MRERSKRDRRNRGREKEGVEKDRYTKLEQDKRKKCSKTDRRKRARKKLRTSGQEEEQKNMKRFCPREQEGSHDWCMTGTFCMADPCLQSAHK